MMDFVIRNRWQIACIFLLSVCVAGAVERITRETQMQTMIAADECPQGVPQEQPVLREDWPEMASYPVEEGQLLIAVYRPVGTEALLPPGGLVSVAAVDPLSDTLELHRGDGEHVLTLVSPEDFE